MRCIDPNLGSLEVYNDDRDMQLAARTITRYDNNRRVLQLADHYAIAPPAAGQTV